MSKSNSLEGKKIAIVHAVFNSSIKGGGEKLMFSIRNHYKADLFAGAIDLQNWDKEKFKNDSFVQDLWDKNYKFDYFHLESPIPIWRKIKRQLFFLVSDKSQVLEKYDIVIFSGHIAFLPRKLKNPLKVLYCHTPPRDFSDQFENLLKSKSKWQHFFLKIFRNWIKSEYTKDASSCDLILTHTHTTQQRLMEFSGLDSTPIFPITDGLDRFKWISQGNYFLSYARLEEKKRLKLIVQAFTEMPDKKLIICSGGPLESWLKNEIETKNLKNISFLGRVTDEKLADLVGNCLAGIYIPINEDAGMTQIELMNAGKPVIGVAEGGLLESVIDGENGILLPENPETKDLIKAVEKMTPKLALSLKEKCKLQAQKFAPKQFFQQLDLLLEEGLKSKSR
jgi:glycosyltransferase involved in cell wall biosynthesis